MATIGVVTLELRLDNSHSLKDKRHVVCAVRSKLRLAETSKRPAEGEDIARRRLVEAGGEMKRRALTGP